MNQSFPISTGSPLFSAEFLNTSRLSNGTLNPFDVINTQRTNILWWTVFTLLINLLSAIANIVLLLAMATHRPLRHSSSCFLIVHCLIIDPYATTIPVYGTVIPMYLRPHHPQPTWYCQYYPLFAGTTFTVEIYTTCVVAFHRLVAALFPRHFRVIATKGAIVFMLVFPWTILEKSNIWTHGIRS